MTRAVKPEKRHVMFYPNPCMDEGHDDHVFWTDDGGIGFSVGGNVVVKPFKEWHTLGTAAPDMLAAAVELDRLMLIIESAVRIADRENHKAVVKALVANLDAIKRAEGR